MAVVERIVSHCFEDINSFLQEAVTISQVMDRYLNEKEKILQEYHFLFGIHEWVRGKPGSLMRPVEGTGTTIGGQLPVFLDKKGDREQGNSSGA